MNSSTQSSTEKFSSATNSYEYPINESNYYRANFLFPPYRTGNNIQRPVISSINKTASANQNNESDQSDFWEREFNPILNSYINSVFKESKQEIETLNEIVGELRKIKTSPDTFNDTPESPTTRSSDDFIERFNKRFNYSISSLDEILDIIDMMQLTNKPKINIRKSKLAQNRQSANSKNQKPANRNIHFNNSDNNQSMPENVSSTDQSYQSQSSDNSLNLPHIHSSEINYLKDRIAKLENENRKIKKINKQQENQISNLANQIEKNSDTRHRLMHAYTLIEGMLKENAETISQLTKQRDSFASLVNRQNIVLKEMDKYCGKLKDEFLVEKLSHGKEKFANQSKFLSAQDEVNAELSKLQEIFYKVLPPSIKSKLNELVSNCPAILTKLNTSISFICRELKNNFNGNENNKVKLSELAIKDGFNSAQNSKLLQFLENDLLFLKKLTETPDLQNIVFYRPQLDHPLLLDSESRQFIIQKCLATRKFIEENIGLYPKSDTVEMIKPFTNSLDSDFIFNLYNTDKFTTQMKQLLSYLPEKNSDSTILYDILFSQSIMNNILQNHLTSLQSQIQYANRQTQILENQIKDKNELQVQTQELSSKNEMLVKNYEDAKKVIKILQNKEKKICKTILNAFPDLSESNSYSQISSESNLSQKVELVNSLYDLIKTLVNRYKEQCSSLDKLKTDFETRLNDMNGEFSCKLANQKEIIKSQKSQMYNLCTQIEKLKNEKSNFQSKITLLQHQISTLNENKNNLKQEVLLMKAQLINKFKALYQFSKKVREMNVKQRQFNKQQQENIAELLNRNEEYKIEVEKSHSKFESTTRKFEKMARKLDEKIKSYESQIKDLQNDRTEDQKELQQLQILVDQLQSKNSALENANKANQMTITVLKDNSTREKEEMEKKHQLCLNSISSNYQTKLNDEIEKNSNLAQGLFELSSRYLDHNFINTSISPDVLIKSIDKYIENIINKLNRLEHEVFDRDSCKELLSIDSNENLVEKINEIVSDLSEKSNQINDYKDELITLNDKMILLKSENEILKNNEKSLRQWERWARRVHSISSSVVCATFSPEQLQNSLEELILSYMNEKNTICKLETLRAEKKCFLKFPKTFLVEKNVYSHNQNVALKTFRAMILVHIGIRRIQRAAGCLPLGYNQEAMMKIVDNRINLDDM